MCSENIDNQNYNSSIFSQDSKDLLFLSNNEFQALNFDCDDDLLNPYFMEFPIDQNKQNEIKEEINIKNFLEEVNENNFLYYSKINTKNNWKIIKKTGKDKNKGKKKKREEKKEKQENKKTNQRVLILEN